MSSKAWLAFLLLALAMVAETYATIDEFATTLEEFDPIISDGDADLIVDDNEFLMSSESTRRSLMHGHPGKGRGRARYISYAALRSNQVPCGRRGRSYYNCNERGRANPYSRGCIAITHCARDTSQIEEQKKATTKRKLYCGMWLRTLLIFLLRFLSSIYNLLQQLPWF